MTEEAKSALDSLLLFAATLCGLLTRGWALAVLWDWFVVPLGVRGISVTHGIGIWSLVHVATYRWAVEHTSEEDTNVAVASLVVGPFSVGVAWVVLKLGGGL